jgi:para-nitrobenzyl esterase
MSPIVQTTLGAVEGESMNGVHRFLGIPYATPPVGDKRWRPPALPPSWEGVRMAKVFGPAAMQGARPDIELQASVAEDCLYINIWTSNLSPAARRPVMVWIHGGGFMFGAGSEPGYDGQALADAGVVLVTFNYRLGPFGFLAHPALGGNFGLQDQLAVLRWIKANAEQFGGDPGNVTVFGESAGAAAISDLMQAAGADALFGRAILQSGGFARPAASRHAFGFDQAQQTAEALLDELECPDFEAARALDAARILEAGERLLQRKLGRRRFVAPDDLIFVPLVDERFAPFDSGRSAAAERQVLLGYNDNEASYFARPEVDFDDDDLACLLEIVAGAKAGIIQAALGAHGDISPQSRMERVMTVAVFVEPAIELAGNLAGSGSPVFLYRFGRISPKGRATRMLASHTFEIPYVFGALSGDGDYDAVDHRLAKEMRSAWVAFARTGTPECGTGKWPSYRPASPQLAFLSDAVVAADFAAPVLFDAFRQLRDPIKVEANS